MSAITGVNDYQTYAERMTTSQIVQMLQTRDMMAKRIDRFKDALKTIVDLSEFDGCLADAEAVAKNALLFDATLLKMTKGRHQKESKKLPPLLSDELKPSDCPDCGHLVEGFCDYEGCSWVPRKSGDDNGR